MSYVLKQFDNILIEFEVLENLSNPVLSIIWINEKHLNLIPMGMEISPEGLADWIRHRSIPKNRAYVTTFLAKCGLNVNRPIDVIDICKGLSLNDSYWVCHKEDDISWNEINLYNHPISRILAGIAFTGYGSSERSSFVSSPEFTTNGMLPKCWRRINGTVYLFKGGTNGASNTGNEPYSEKYAYEIGKNMGLNMIPYSINKWKGMLCSSCEIFTDENIGFIPVGRIVKKGGMKAVRTFYEELGSKYVKSLNEMIVFDAIICNTDRHFGNFGFLIDNKKNKIIDAAPLFDHGNSLFNFVGEFWRDENELSRYIETLKPCVYEDFIDEAVKVMDNKIKDKVRRLLDFRFEKTGKYNYPKEKLKMIENQVRHRAQLLLESSKFSS